MHRLCNIPITHTHTHTHTHTSPTKTAKRGRYGAFLLPSGSYLVDIVRHLATHLSPCPVTVKVRLLPGPVERSLDLYRALIDAGAAMLTIHGRTQAQKGVDTGAADWDKIRRVVQELGARVPILANGNIACHADALACLEYTGADGVMSSEAVLEYPPQVLQPPCSINGTRPGPGRLGVARQYLDWARHYPPERGGGATGMQCLQMHVDTFLHADWQCAAGQEIRDAMRQTERIEELDEILDRVELLQKESNHSVEGEELSWYYRHWDDKDDESATLDAET